MIPEKEFRDRIARMSKKIKSKSGKAFYTNFKTQGDTLFFQRVVPKTDWKLDLKKLYSENSFINTTVVKRDMKGRVNSPSVAVLMAIGCIDDKGHRK